MSKLWKIYSLYYGKINVPKGVMTAGLDPDLMIDIPYTGFLLQNGEENILVAWGKWGVEQGVIKGKFGHQGKEEQAGGVFLFAGGVEEALD